MYKSASLIWIFLPKRRNIQWLAWIEYIIQPPLQIRNSSLHIILTNRHKKVALRKVRIHISTALTRLPMLDILSHPPRGWFSNSDQHLSIYSLKDNWQQLLSPDQSSSATRITTLNAHDNLPNWCCSCANNTNLDTNIKRALYALPYYNLLTTFRDTVAHSTGWSFTFKTKATLG